MNPKKELLWGLWVIYCYYLIPKHLTSGYLYPADSTIPQEPLRFETLKPHTLRLRAVKQGNANKPKAMQTIDSNIPIPLEP